MGTHTQFFSDGDLVGLRAEIERLTVDWQQRRSYVDSELRDRGDHRLEMLRLAAALLSEHAD